MADDGEVATDGTMKLPGADKAEVPTKKLLDYLLSLEHPDGQFKARFFMQFGFEREDAGQLADALRRHAMDHDAEGPQSTTFGEKWVLEGDLRTPNGRNPRIRTVWFIATGTKSPRLVTAYPLEDLPHD